MDVYLFQPSSDAPPYIFASEDDARTFAQVREADPDLDVERGSVCDHADTLKLIGAECEATPEAEASSLESGVPVATYAWRKGENAPYSSELLAVEYVVYRPDSGAGDGQEPRKTTLWVGLDPDVGAPNVDAGRERLEAEGFLVTDWAAV